MTDAEINNWIEAMLETGQTEHYGYWKPGLLVRCPFNQPLAEITEV